MNAGAPTSLVVIEDDPAIRDLLVTTLTEAGYAVWAGEGEEAIGYCLWRPPRLVLLDLLMPYPGETVRRHLLAFERTRRVPVLLLTAADRSAQWVEDLACVGQMLKPFHIEALWATVAAILLAEETDTP